MLTSLRARAIAVAVVGLIAVATACGGASDDTAGPEPSHATTAEAPTETATSAPSDAAAAEPTATGQPEPTASAQPTATVETDEPGSWPTQVASVARDRQNAVPYVLVGVDPMDRLFVAYFDDEGQALRFLSCDDATCSSWTEGGSFAVDEPRWLGIWPSLEWSPEGLPVVGVGRSRAPEFWASVLACSDQACSDYSETRVDDVVFMDLDVADDGTTRVFGGEIGWDPDVGADGLELMICADPTCASGVTRVDIDGWRNFTPHQVALAGGNPVAVYEGPSLEPGDLSVEVVECLDPECLAIQTSSIDGSHVFAISANAERDVALLRDFVDPAGSEGPLTRVGLFLDTWEQDYSNAAVVELDAVAPVEGSVLTELEAGTPLGWITFGAQSVAIGPDGTPAAAWIRTTVSVQADASPAEALAWAGWNPFDLDEFGGPEVLRSLGVTSEEGVLIGFLETNSAALRAGLDVYDVVTAVNENPVGSARELVDLVDSAEPGDTLALTYDRFGETRTTDLTLAAAFDELVLARCDDTRCNSGTIAIVERTPLRLVQWASLAIDTNNRPVLAYRLTGLDATDDIVIHRCNERTCTDTALGTSTW